MDRDGHQGWSRKAEEGWLRVFDEAEGPPVLTRPGREPQMSDFYEPGPKNVAFPDAIERKIAEGFTSPRVDDESPD